MELEALGAGFGVGGGFDDEQHRDVGSGGQGLVGDEDVRVGLRAFGEGEFGGSGALAGDAGDGLRGEWLSFEILVEKDDAGLAGLVSLAGLSVSPRPDFRPKAAFFLPTPALPPAAPPASPPTPPTPPPAPPPWGRPTGRLFVGPTVGPTKPTKPRGWRCSAAAATSTSSR
jgi:hypothetical protein